MDTMIRRPQWLNEEGKKYWERNALALFQAAILTEANLDDFCLLCEVWGFMRAANPTDSKERIWYLGLLKQYQPLRKLFTLPERVDDFADLIGKGLE